MTVKKSALEGIVPIMAATFTPAGLLDEASFQALVQHLIKAKVNGLTLFGLVTEFYKLTDHERAKMQSLMLAQTALSEDSWGIISITDHSREVAVLRAQAAEAEGADALMLLPPFFLSPGEEAIAEHIRQVITSVQIPVIIQYAPAQTGVRLAPQFFVELQQSLPETRQIFVKVETQPPGRYITQLLEASTQKIGALVGYAGVQMPDVMQRGAAGIQPGSAFVEIYLEIYERFKQADISGMNALHQQVLPYINTWMQGIEMIIRVEKTILHKRGIIASDYCRQPTYSLDKLEIVQIEAFLAEFAAFLK